MRLRFGLETEEPLTLSEIGREMNLSVKRVRQLQAKAIKKLLEKSFPIPDKIRLLPDKSEEKGACEALGHWSFAMPCDLFTSRRFIQAPFS